MFEFSATRADFHTCGTEFLLRELELALTFMDLASVSTNADRARRAHSRAAHAHQTVLRFLPNIRPEVQQKCMIERNLTRLESRMRIAGLSINTTVSS